MEQRKIIGYKLIKKYPQSNALGTFYCKYKHATFIKQSDYLFNEFFEPVYEEEKLEIIDWDVYLDESKFKYIVDKKVDSVIYLKGKLTQEIVNKIKEVL